MDHRDYYWGLSFHETPNLAGGGLPLREMDVDKLNM